MSKFTTSMPNLKKWTLKPRKTGPVVSAPGASITKVAGKTLEQKKAQFQKKNVSPAKPVVAAIPTHRIMLMPMPDSPDSRKKRINLNERIEMARRGQLRIAGPEEINEYDRKKTEGRGRNKRLEIKNKLGCADRDLWKMQRVEWLEKAHEKKIRAAHNRMEEEKKFMQQLNSKSMENKRQARQLQRERAENRYQRQIQWAQVLTLALSASRFGQEVRKLRACQSMRSLHAAAEKIARMWWHRVGEKRKHASIEILKELLLSVQSVKRVVWATKGYLRKVKLVQRLWRTKQVCLDAQVDVVLDKWWRVDELRVQHDIKRLVRADADWTKAENERINTFNHQHTGTPVRRCGIAILQYRTIRYVRTH
jgi:hypothetical protein